MKRPVRALTLLYLLSLFFLFTLDIKANAETISGPFRDNCPRYPVCLMNGTILKTKYGSITAQRNMVFNRIDVNANGSIILDLSTWVPRAEEILIFKAASFGNGTFPIQILGYPITAVSFAAPYTVQYAAQLTGGLGGIVNLVAGSNMTSALQLVINYTPFGGTCIPACVAGTPFWVWVFFLAGAGLLGVLVISSNRKKTVEKEEPDAVISRE